MSVLKDDLAIYLAAVRALNSDNPTVRRPAISRLLDLARQAKGALRANAARVLTDEFGPYAVNEGLSGCSAPIETVHVCDGNCRSCVWLWQEADDPYLQSNPVASDAPDLQPPVAVGFRSRKSVA